MSVLDKSFPTSMLDERCWRSEYFSVDGPSSAFHLILATGRSTDASIYATAVLQTSS